MITVQSNELHCNGRVSIYDGKIRTFNLNYDIDAAYTLWVTKEMQIALGINIIGYKEAIKRLKGLIKITEVENDVYIIERKKSDKEDEYYKVATVSCEYGYIYSVEYDKETETELEFVSDGMGKTQALRVLKNDNIDDIRIKMAEVLRIIPSRLDIMIRNNYELIFEMEEKNINIEYVLKEVSHNSRYFSINKVSTTKKEYF